MWKLYGFWHWYDMPMHFLGGVAMALLAWATWDMFVRDIKFTVRYPPRQKRVAFMLWLVGFTAIIGIGWEWFEFGFDRFVLPTLQGWAPAQASITDTMADFFLTSLARSRCRCFDVRYDVAHYPLVCGLMTCPQTMLLRYLRRGSTVTRNTLSSHRTLSLFRLHNVTRNFVTS